MPAAYPGPWEYFVRKVRIGLPDECWEWRGRGLGDHYGKWAHAGTHRNAHRATYELFYGPIEEGQVNHTCDNKRCCNPDHLYLGSQSDNMRDVVKRGLFANQKGKSLLNESRIREIRRLLRLGESHSSIAKRFGVSRSTVTVINRNRSWTWVED